MKKYYTYKITDKNTGCYYFGSRGFNGIPSDDTYMGSPHVWKPEKKNLKKEILNIFDNYHDAIMDERLYVIKHITDVKNQNYSIPHPKITRNNLISVIDKLGNTFTICSYDELFGIEYFGVTKGQVLVRDKNDSVFYVSVNDERYLNGELRHNNYGRMISGIEHPNYNKHWINNGELQKLISGNVIPDNWIVGTLQKGKRTISSHYKTIWVNNGVDNKRIAEQKIDEFLTKGWLKGRINLKKYEKR